MKLKRNMPLLLTLALCLTGCGSSYSGAYTPTPTPPPTAAAPVTEAVTEPAGVSDAEKYARIVLANEQMWMSNYVSDVVLMQENVYPMCWFEDLDFDGKPEFLVGGADQIGAQFPCRYDFYTFDENDAMVEYTAEAGKEYYGMFNAPVAEALGLAGMYAHVIKNVSDNSYHYVYPAYLGCEYAEILTQLRFDNARVEERTIGGFAEIADQTVPAYYGADKQVISKEELTALMEQLREEYVQCEVTVGPVPITKLSKDLHSGADDVGPLSCIVSDCYDYLSEEEKLQALMTSYQTYRLTDTTEKPRLVEIILQQLSTQSDAPDEDALYNAVKAVAGNITAWKCYDYDGDGKEEAFAVIGKGEDEIVAVYFVNSNAEVTCMRQDFWGGSYFASDLADTVVDGRRFFAVTTHNGGSGSWAYIFGVVNGSPKEFLKGERYDSFYVEGGTLIGCTVNHDNGLGYDDHPLRYNESRQDLEEGTSQVQPPAPPEPDAGAEAWKTAYIDYIQKFSSYADGTKFALLNVNGDAIPELYCRLGYSNAVMLTYISDTKTVEEVSSGDCGTINFMEGDNLFWCSSGKGCDFYDMIYEIGDFGFSVVSNGYYREEDDGCTYYLGDGQVSESDYYAAINRLIDRTKAKNCDDSANDTWSTIADGIRGYH